MIRFDDIPCTSAPGPDAAPSAVLARIRAVRPGRRAVVRSLVIAAATGALVPMDWLISRSRAKAAPTDPPGTSPELRAAASEYTTCAPKNYDEESNDWWSDTSTQDAVCYGGWRRGSVGCDDTGFHREGTFSSRGESYESVRISNSCQGRNAWRWKGYRCSDAWTVATLTDGSEYSALTISACAVSES